MDTSQLPVDILLIAILCLGAFSQNSTDSDIQWRTIYVTPEESTSQIGCPVDHCYYLQDVFSNSSYFFDSYTTLELLPGMYDITEEVGQLVLIEVKNFTLKGSTPNVTITCQPGATLGLTIIRSHWVKISNIQISNCSAKLQLKGNSSTILTAYNKQVKQYLDHNLSSCDTNGNSYPACYTFLANFENKKVAIYETAILHSKGIGIFSIDSNGLEISKTLLAYNQINCITFMQLETTSTTFNMSHSQIKFGKIRSYYSFEFASGLNLFVHLNSETHNISLTNITLANNRGAHGNLYMVVRSRSRRSVDINMNILINNISSIQTVTRNTSPGMVIKYAINLENTDEARDRTLSYLLGPIGYRPFGYYTSSFKCSHEYSYLYDSDCYPWALMSRTWPSIQNPFRSQVKRVHIVLQNVYIIGSCVVIKDSGLSIVKSWFRFEMNNITISESRCLTALSVIDSEIDYHLQLSNLTIVNSHSNILSVNIPGSYSSKLTIMGNISFLKNQGSVSLLSGAVELEGFVLISGNTAHKYESVLQIGDSCEIYFKGEIMFFNNTGRQGGAISAYSSNLYFDGNVSFIGNSAVTGGAISLKEGAVINLRKDTHVSFTGNFAETYGGAIYIEDAGSWKRRRVKCFLHITYEHEYYDVEFENNTAGIAGGALFGGWIDYCGTKYDIKPSHILEFKTDNSVASNPTRVCMCTNSALNKYKVEAHIEVFPGQIFEIEAVAVGQRFGMIPASIRAETGSNVIDQLQKLQDTDNQCTKLKFTVHSSNRNETILLSIDGQLRPKWINESINIPDEFLKFKMFITLQECPLGFEFDSRKNVCSCQPYLEVYGVQCNYTTYKINRHAQQWIGVLNPTVTRIVVIHQHCPDDYCKSYALSLNLSTPDYQCSSNRSGILCGACQPGLSQVLGTSNCKRCSNLWILLTFVFALAGVLLVAGLVLLNFTVSTGTINGFIFYANIVRANTAIFFPDKTVNTFLSWFIAWLNLDVGIETCFYDGLDAYMKTWLQFIFPLYIWFLVTIIIISSKYSKRAANTFGVNAVQVLATLFLLSYAKLLRVTITVFQPTRLLDNHNVWHYDGNVAYLGKRHALLMLVALLFFVLFLLPYTLVLFGIQWLQIFSHYKPFRWVNKLKPLFDAYTGPYKDKHRYWTGLLLLIRIGLFIVFSTNTSGDPAINLLAIVTVILCLFAYLAMFGGVYKSRLLNFLDYSTLLNLAILSAAILYTTSANKQRHILSQASVIITLCTTMLVVAYHGMVVALKASKLDTKAAVLWRSNKTDKQLPEIADEMQQHDMIMNPQVTRTIIELKEPLLEY